MISADTDHYVNILSTIKKDKKKNQLKKQSPFFKRRDCGSGAFL